ncbi:MAG: integration host factor, actinobacterial type [Gaiellales bacterium]
MSSTAASDPSAAGAAKQALLRHETPTRSASQRQSALERANQIRVRRAALKRDLKSGERKLADVLARPSEWVLTAKVHDLLVCVPGIGAVKAARMLQQCRVSGSKTVGGLSDRQRTELVALLRR